MSTSATYIKDIVIRDPDTGGDVDITLFKHENGGIFGVDASYIDQVADETPQGYPILNDPLQHPNPEVGRRNIILYYPDDVLDPILEKKHKE